ncbi:hypothetical protein PGTUg99_019785 [Puccinia graminis f. sp. tritici]|uniref:Uncharacterized protein n=1 Tax=Puccinia graminis f. sp. tritici TaxID=56615 RepID=A0A5B0SLS9_PUCGR|nr:hypothetical protein PGTUg99_019785 [Puccinia graminis f. sp. tritici]
MMPMTAAVQCCDALRLRSDGSRRSFACEFGRADYVNLSRRGEGRRGSSQMTLYSLRTQYSATTTFLVRVKASTITAQFGNPYGYGLCADDLPSESTTDSHQHSYAAFLMIPQSELDWPAQPTKHILS